MELCVRNKAKATISNIITYLLELPMSLILELNNCYYVLQIFNNIISISCLDQEGLVFTFKNKSCSFSHANIFYGSNKLVNGLYILKQKQEILTIENKKPMFNKSLDLSYIWQCRLRCKNETRITNLHKNRYWDQFCV